MKISASIYSDKNKDILDTIKDLNDSHVDYIHVDCNDNLNVFADIETIQRNSHIPIDLHIITSDAGRFYPALEKFDIDFVTFQYEDLTNKKLQIPKEFTGQLGLAITTNTDISVFEDYKEDFDFILFMATVPGQSGGKFDPINFRKIREFKSKYPDKKVHVDGGVNGEVSFILRNMGVDASVSGSYLFNSTNINSALLNLKLNEIESHFLVGDFMRDLSESPVVYEHELSLKTALEKMAAGKLGFVMVLGEDDKMRGIIGNGDLRNGLLKNIKDLNDIKVSEIINENPLTINRNYTVFQLLRFIKNQNRPVLYLPVINDSGQAVGTVNFMNLIKGEL
ncbi:MAG: CBS domain-containing protein [Crocinitomicaceae bacterium]|jgi:ribulose-phosphate 3-epimerase|nr:CBS domain-containing protein [Crocinitomicaceae bacterium]